MNFLAHIALSGQNPKLIMGNFSGDYVKGKLDFTKKMEFAPDFLDGLRLHRFIDHLTDTHPIVKEMIRQLRGHYGRGASIVTDIAFDHFLARNFNRFYDLSLRDFVDGFYKVYSEYSDLIPVEMRPLAESLVENDWLFKYREWETVERTLKSMARRYTFLGDFSRSPTMFKENLGTFEAYFLEFYPGLKRECERFLAGRGVGESEGGDLELS